MALYLAMTFWLIYVVLAAWGVHRLWCGLVKPRVVNILLLPGTLAAQLGHVLGLLITGATVTDTSLAKDETAEPGTTRDAKPRIPVIGPMVIGMLPLLACGGGVFAVARALGGDVPAGIGSHRIADSLPMSGASAWQFVRDQVSAVEAFVDASTAALPGNWRTWLFYYLVICLAVRMAPFPGSLRGSLGAIVLLGAALAALGMALDSVPVVIESGWSVLSLIVQTLTFLLMFSALIRGMVGLGKMIVHNE